MSKHKHRGKKPQENESPASDNANPPVDGESQPTAIHTIRIQYGPEEELRHAAEQEDRLKELRQAKVLNIISGCAAAIALLALIGVAYNARLVHSQVLEMQHANKISTEAFNANERPLVGLGRKDGILAEFAVPGQGTPDQNVGIKIYLQNSGLSPALTPNLGINFTLHYLGIGQKQSPPPVVPLQTGGFQHLARFRTKDGGTNIQRGDTGLIAPQSERLYFFPDKLTRGSYESVLQGKGTVLIQGTCEYCDDLGRYYCRQFMLAYYGPPFNAFYEVSEYDCADMYVYPPLPATGAHWLLPCEQPEERQARDKHEHQALSKQTENSQKAPPTAKRRQ